MRNTMMKKKVGTRKRKRNIEARKKMMNDEVEESHRREKVGNGIKYM